MDTLGIGNLPSATSTNISALKKALQTQETMLGKILEGANPQSNNTMAVQSSSISPEAKSIVAEATQKGGTLDMSA